MTQMILPELLLGLLPELKTKDEYSEFWKSRSVLRPLVEKICQQHGHKATQITLVKHSSNIIFEVDDFCFFKLYAPFFADEFAREKEVLDFLKHKMELAIPDILFSGEVQGWHYFLLTKVPGVSLNTVWHELTTEELIEVNKELGRAIAGVHQLTPPHSEQLFVDLNWHDFISQQAKECAENQRKKNLAPEWVEQIDDFLQENLHLTLSNPKRVLVCADYHDGNLLVTKLAGKWRLSGVVDFADAMIGAPEYDFGAPGIYVAKSRPELLRAFFYGYGFKEIDQQMMTRCFTYTLLHRFSNLNYYLQQLQQQHQSRVVNLSPQDFHLKDLRNFLWPL